MNVRLWWRRLEPETETHQETVYWGFESNEKEGDFLMSLTTVRLLTETSGVETMQVQDTSALDSLFFFYIYGGYQKHVSENIFVSAEDTSDNIYTSLTPTESQTSSV